MRLGGRSGRARADGVVGRGRHPQPHVARGADDAVAHAVAAQGVRAAIEGTLRRDFSKGLLKGLSKDFNIYKFLGTTTQVLFARTTPHIRF